MASKVYSDTRFTTQVKSLLNKVYGRSILKDSFLERAISFYDGQPFNQNKLDKLKGRIAELKAHKDDEKVQRQIDKVEREYRELKQELKDESNERNKQLMAVCREIIDLSEGVTFNESCRKSAQLLGTIQLLSPTEGKRVAEVNEKHKPLYKAVLCLRLLDKLCLDNAFTSKDAHLKEYLQEISGENYRQWQKVDADAYQAFVDNVKIPVVMAALIQDIGNFHPEAQKILAGETGKLDVHRTLAVEERKALLQVNYRETISFLVEGIGAPIYIGNSKTDRDKFNIAEHKKLVFIKHLLKHAISPKQGIGNLLKVPQIYASIVLSTKASYNYKLLPKVYQALNQNAERGTCSQYVVDALREITGDFPQGFGIAFIPKDSDGKAGEHYEYAIVNQLYPENVEFPLCRTATRSLTFIGHGQDIEIPLSSNLYHTETAKAFSSMSKDRLNEILEKLASNYQERKTLDLLPRCWHAGDFFSKKVHQKLWNKT
ncbi:hypothetical protein tinsulaeT_14780 [Thalassotalea insulae]|uniref:Uncharacterized protein n=1 Tax=Thalassotalea insulae TaxID=2056778 RepID=A0ABQ6GQ84_9GAMM|nr:hypothetical protein [Thalassotalea insulae]GLX78138.1 hypothetical protein tinsulaeT_14780 [Thalassotalea insulae]